MKLSFRILRVSGIDVRVHVTFVIIVLLGANYFRQFYGTAGLWFGALLICALFACITLHELGHSLVAQRFGVEVKEIVLLPIGGLAQLSREPSKAWHELLIAICGPLVNVVIAGGLLAALWPNFHDIFPPAATAGPPTLHAFATYLLWGNVSLAVFNMIPALPMDGGRVLRALLTMFIGKLRATQIASIIGQVLAVALVVFALSTPADPMLALIGVFVFFTAAHERAHQQAASSLGELRAGEVCNPDALALSTSDHLGGVVDQLLRAPQSAFAVMHGERLLGVLTRDDVLRAAPVLGPNALVSQIMRREFRAASSEIKLDELRALLLEVRAPVVINGPDGVMGVMTLEDLSRIAMVMQELARRGLRRPVTSPAPEV